MRFTKLTIENYKSFQFTTEIVFPAGRSGSSIFLIGGMNGAGKTSIMEAVNYCLYGAKQDSIYKDINRREIAKGNASVMFELVMEMDDGSELIIKRSWSAGAVDDPKPRDLHERLVIVRDGKRVSVQNQEIWQEFIRAAIPPGITQFFFFDGEKIQEIAADDHSEVRLKSSLEAALGIQSINKLASDLAYIKQEERKGFVDISDEDLEFKQSELKKYRSKLTRQQKERDCLKSELIDFRNQLNDTKRRFELTFQAEPETREKMREQEKRHIQASNRLTQIESEIRNLCEKSLPFALSGKMFDDIRKQISDEQGSVKEAAMKENATELAKRILQAIEEPEPIYKEKLSSEQSNEFERRIVNLFEKGSNTGDNSKLLDLSSRDAARILNQMEAIERSEVYLIQPLLEEKRALKAQVKSLSGLSSMSGMSESEKEIFDQMQSEMESCSVQIGRKTEQLHQIEEGILTLEKRMGDIELEIEKLYESHNISKEKAGFIEECDNISSVLSQFIVRLRKNKVHLLQEKTFEMYKLLSSRSGLIKDLTIDDKSYEIRIHDRNGHEIKKSGLSAGEKEVFALSLLWGLAQTSQLKLPIIIDTPLSRLDSVHRDNIVNNYFPNAGEQVIILSTDTEIDTNYYKNLKPYLSGAGCLVFDQRQELTTFKNGYFWEY